MKDVFKSFNESINEAKKDKNVKDIINIVDDYIQFVYDTKSKEDVKSDAKAIIDSINALIGDIDK